MDWGGATYNQWNSIVFPDLIFVSHFLSRSRKNYNSQFIDTNNDYLSIKGWNNLKGINLPEYLILLI